MNSPKKFTVSHAPFWHNGSSVSQRSYHTMLAAAPAVVWGMICFGMPAVGVVSLAISSAIIWEYLMNRAMKKPLTIGDGNAALVGLLLGMLLPATAPWWLVIVGTFLAIVVGKEIFGGIGSNPFHPVALSVAILMVSWSKYFDFNAMLVNYDVDFHAVYPLWAVKNFGVDAIAPFHTVDLALGLQLGAIGAIFGLGLIAGGVYLILRGFIRWEIPVAFLAALTVTAALFNMADPARFAPPAFHIFTGYTLIGAFFLATEDASSPVNIIPMFIYGAVGGMMTVLIRNIGVWVDGVVLAILLMNLLSPLLDKIRPKALGKVI